MPRMIWRIAVAAGLLVVLLVWIDRRIEQHVEEELVRASAAAIAAQQAEVLRLRESIEEMENSRQEP